jgi:hypothetical protein
MLLLTTVVSQSYDLGHRTRDVLTELQSKVRLEQYNFDFFVTHRAVTF